MKNLEQISAEIDKINFDRNKLVILDSSAELILVPYKHDMAVSLKQNETYEIWVKMEDSLQKTTKIGEYVVPGTYQFMGFKKTNKKAK